MGSYKQNNQGHVELEFEDEEDYEDMQICVPEDMNIPWEGGPQEVRATADTVPPGARASNRGYRTTWGPPSEYETAPGLGCI